MPGLSEAHRDRALVHAGPGRRGQLSRRVPAAASPRGPDARAADRETRARRARGEGPRDRARALMRRLLAAEFIGTFFLVLIGPGAAAVNVRTGGSVGVAGIA